MAAGYHNQERVPENLRTQLAVAVRSIQWSYAIFWSISPRERGVLEWGEGYYNGDIKTRKTIQAVEFNADQMGLLRSEQLRELFESLSASESSPQARRPSAALSPEDLTDTEWYYLVCMSFVLSIGQGFPGRTLTNGQPIWLCNAHCADSKIFSRSLLAKSASIQTVVCFPYLGGVIELGVTELVQEDPGLIQHIKTSFLKIPCTTVSQITRSISGNEGNDVDHVYNELGRDILDPMNECGRVEVNSPDSSSNGLGLNQEVDNSFMVEGLHEGASQMQSWQFMDEEISNCIHNSTSSSDCISQTLVNTGQAASPVSGGKNANDGCSVDLQERNKMKMSLMGLQAVDDHYQGVVSSLLKSSHQLILGPHFRKLNQGSSFAGWRELLGIQIPQNGLISQRLLKKMLFEVPRMHDSCSRDSRQNEGRLDGPCRQQADDVDSNHVLSERKRRERISHRFSVLGSLIPSASKVDKVSILDNTIEYLKELEKRVGEFESRVEVGERKARARRKPQDTSERISDNYGSNISNSKKPSTNKRKACASDEMGNDSNRPLLKDSSTDRVKVTVAEKDILIEIRCPWRDSLLLEVMDAMSHLHLDSHSVQSTNADGIMSLTVKSKFKGSRVGSAGTITQALRRVVRKS